MSDDDTSTISAWTERLLALAPGLSPDQGRQFVHDLYFAAQRTLDREQSDADFDRDE